MMPKYRKKPVEIEAIQWDGENTTEILAFCSDCFSYKKNDFAVLVINTLEGTMKASIGDYVIKGVKGEFYACKPDIFLLTYDQVTN
jgi:hypothetical protein